MAWYSAWRTPIVITFEHPIQLKRVEAAQRWPSDREGPNWFKLTGDDKTLLEFYDNDRDWGSLRYRWFDCDDIGYFTVLRLYYSYGSGSGKIGEGQF